jgi:FkbM family methyltransferase
MAIDPATTMRLIGRKITAVVRLACWRTLNPSLTSHSGITLRVRSEGDWDVLREIFIDRDYDGPIQAALDAVSPGRPLRILDLGANTGFFALRCVDLHRRAQLSSPLDIIAVEGAPSAFAELQRRVVGLSGTGVTLSIRKGLVGRRSGMAKIYTSPFLPNLNGVVPRAGKTSHNLLLGRHAEDSQYLDLSNLVPGTGSIDLIKCDIEGSELEFLQNYSDLLRRTRLLVIEFHPLRCDINLCRELLESYGFTHERTIADHPTHSLHVWRSALLIEDVSRT